MADGSTAKFSVVGSDAASGVNNLATSIGGSIVSIKGFDNTAKINGQNQRGESVRNAQNQKPTILTNQATDPATGITNTTQEAVFAPTHTPTRPR